MYFHQLFYEHLNAFENFYQRNRQRQQPKRGDKFDCLSVTALKKKKNPPRQEIGYETLNSLFGQKFFVTSLCNPPPHHTHTMKAPCTHMIQMSTGKIPTLEDCLVSFLGIPLPGKVLQCCLSPCIPSCASRQEMVCECLRNK